jgi:hypothetical protein
MTTNIVDGVGHSAYFSAGLLHIGGTIRAEKLVRN